MKLGVNIDHVATLRQARRGSQPDPAGAALLCQASGADSIVCHLREDRRHINENDLYLLKKVLKCRLNLEMSAADEIVDIACDVKPDQATLVPERRQELTTEGGLDVVRHLRKIATVCRKLSGRDISISLFIDPEKRQIDASKKLGVEMVELHTGRYADANTRSQADKYFKELSSAARYARSLGLTVNAGHGLDYSNVSRMKQIHQLEELNIGYSIICRAVFVGLERAVREMKTLIS